MSFVAPLAAVDPALAAMFTFSSGPLQVPDRQLHYSSAITAQEQISDRMKADPTDRRSSNQVLPSAPITVQAESQLRSPTDEEVVELFERIHKNRSDFFFLPGDMRKTLDTQLRWSVKRNRITRLWEKVTRSAAHNGGSIIVSPTEKKESEQIETLQSDMITTPFSSASKKSNKIYLSSLTKQAVAETTLAEQKTLTSPSTIEIMTFLWELEEDHPRVTENIHNLLILMERQKCWQVSEERLDRILLEMDQADAEDVFAMPMTNTLRSSHERNSTGMAPRTSNNAVHSATVAAKEKPASPATSAPSSFLRSKPCAMRFALES